MAATTTSESFSCSSCGHSSLQWFGRCPGCGAWSSAQLPASDTALEVTSLGTGASTVRVPSGLHEVDRVLGGGFVAGEAVLLAGEPGIGKSTLVLQVLDALMSSGATTLLVTGEESTDQVSLRASRLGLELGAFRVASSTSLPAVMAACERERPDVLVVDSIQTLADPALEQTAGTTIQVRECAAALVGHAKRTGTVVILVGHVTKEGTVAGPKTLEHIVDAVLALEGERGGELRVLRATKNRFGSCDETGVFVMRAHGLEVVGDPSAMLLADRRAGITGSVVFPSLEGSRTVLVELQALVAPSSSPQPRRVALGLDARKLALLLGVLARRAEVVVADNDVFVAAAGGLAIREPAADLALCLALASATWGAPVDERLVAVGEVGLGGEIRRAPGIGRRLAEAARLGFCGALVPPGVREGPPGFTLVEVGELSNALAHARMHPHIARSAEASSVLPLKAG